MNHCLCFVDTGKPERFVVAFGRSPGSSSGAVTVDEDRAVVAGEQFELSRQLGPDGIGGGVEGCGRLGQDILKEDGGELSLSGRVRDPPAGIPTEGPQRPFGESRVGPRRRRMLVSSAIEPAAETAELAKDKDAGVATKTIVIRTPVHRDVSGQVPAKKTEYRTWKVVIFPDLPTGIGSPDRPCVRLVEGLDTQAIPSGGEDMHIGIDDEDEFSFNHIHCRIEGEGMGF